MKPLISCVIPAYNSAAYLGEAIESALTQTYAPVEVVVVDDGSSDETPSIVAGFGDRISGIRQKNAGASAARNRGVAETTGSLLTFLDADDKWHAEKLERQHARFAARPELGMCTAYVENFWIDALKDEAAEMARIGDPRAKPSAWCSLQSLMVRRDVWDAVGPLDETHPVAHDLDWFVRARELHVVEEVMDDVLVYRRLHHDNITRTREAEIGGWIVDIFHASLARRRAAGDIPGPPNV